MATKAPGNPRHRKLNAITSRIRMFLTLEADGHDQKARELLYEAIDCIDAAAVLLDEADDKAKDAA